LVILNTVGEALDLHKRVQDDVTLSGYRLFHLSTNLRPKDRNRILREIKECSDQHILIATQVVEAGVDVSFDVVVRAIAPLDSLVQAAGRCNRHGSGIRGRVIVIAPKSNSSLSIYGSLHIVLTRQMLQEVALLPGGKIAEPELTDKVDAYFAKLNERIQKDSAARIQEAIGQLQFAALRGEGQDKDRRKKRVQLIDDQQNRVSHFVETDESDASIWRRFTKSLVIQDIWQRRRQLRSLRNDLGQRIVEVPQQFRFGAEAAGSSIVWVPMSVAEHVYHVDTGWKRVQ
jgi:CRISPR-associated endonuclease/helicase Cas3